MIEEWIDCGNKEAVVHANQRMLDIKTKEKLIMCSAKTKHSVVIPPCFIGENAHIENSIIGPYVSVGNNTTVLNSVLTNCVVGEETMIQDSNLSNSMIGNYVEYVGRKAELSISDYSKFNS
jgi:glucose-1-phosphate thymidylyltransferase